MPQSNELRVFISSTFRDLQEEREHLIKKIFPEIRSLCRARGIRFTEVDLRWGLTDEDVGLGRVIRTCLEEVDRCRPYFIGITGDRYGYIPTFLDIQKDHALLEQYPWIEDAALDEMSITEMEAQYGVLDRRVKGEEGRVKGEDVERARFYFRRQRASLDDTANDDEERTRLAAYQERIRAAGVSVEQFRDAGSLGELIYDDLIEIIKRDFADAKLPTPLDEERARHEAFSLSRRRAYIANPVYLKRLNEHAASDAPPLVVYAESGSGKSSLFAYWAEQYRRKHPDAHVIEHYVGIGATATDHYAVIRHVCMEINERFGRTEEIPSEPAKLDLALGQWLGYADHELRKQHSASDSSLIPASVKQCASALVIILDGLNQLQGTALNLRWIPDVISPSIRLILSSTVEGTLVELQKRGWSRFGMQALSEAERETIVVRYLGEYHKSLNPEQIKRIASDYKCGHPLFLKTLLEELRLIGRHEDLEIRIAEYLESTGTEDLFQRMLERMEEDHGARVVRETLSLVWACRSGVDEAELADLTGSSRLKLATLIAGLDYHLVRKEGRLTFFHDYLRRAVEKRYLGDKQLRRRIHLRLAEFFDQRELNSRTALERIWQYTQAGGDAKLAATLGDLSVVWLLYSGTGLYEVLTRWARLRDVGYDPEVVYVESLDRLAETAEVSEHLKMLAMVGRILERLGALPAAIAIYRRALSTATTGGFDVEAAQAARSLGGVLAQRADNDEAMEHLEWALPRLEALGDRHGVACAMNNIGTVYANSDAIDRSLEFFTKSLSILEELGDRQDFAVALLGASNALVSRGEYERALEYLSRSVSNAEEFGDLLVVAAAVNNIGMVHFRCGRLERALEYFHKSLVLSEQLGDRHGVAAATGNLGVVYANHEQWDRALECHNRCLSISEELGDRRGVGFAISSMGRVFIERGEYDRALEYINRGRSLYEANNDPNGAANCIGNLGVVYSLIGDSDRALESFKQCLSINEELGIPLDVANSLTNIGGVYVHRGEFELALEFLDRGLHQKSELGASNSMISDLQSRIESLLAILMMDTMPEFLPKHVPGATAETWRALSLRSARDNAEELVATATENSRHSALFNARVTLVRLEVAEGNLESARQIFSELHEADTTDDQRAALHYWLWKLGLSGQDTGHREEIREEALRLYTALYEATPKHEYKQRIEELGITSQPTTPEETDGAG